MSIRRIERHAIHRARTYQGQEPRLDISGVRDADTAWIEGDLRQNKGKWASAVAAFDRALTLDPDHPLAAGGRSLLLDKGDRRLKRLDALISGWPDSQRLWLYRGYALREEGRLAEAFEAFREASDREPNDPVAWLLLATTAGKLGRADERKRALEAAINAGLMSLHTVRRASVLLFRTGHAAKAFRVAWQAARRSPDRRARLLPLVLPWLSLPWVVKLPILVVLFVYAPVLVWRATGGWIPGLPQIAMILAVFGLQYTSDLVAETRLLAREGKEGRRLRDLRMGEPAR